MDPNSDYVYDDVPVRAEVTSAQRATPKELVAMASEIWKAVKASGVPKDDDRGNDDLLRSLQDKYHDFNQSFPLVLRWMVQARSYSAKAFEKYLVQHAGLRLDSREDFLRLQAEYLVQLLRAKTPHIDEKQVKQYRENIMAALLKEDEEFMATTREVEEDMARASEELSRERKARLYEALLAEKLRRADAAKAHGAGLS